MFQTIATKLKIAFSVVVLGLQILRWCGLRELLKRTASQLNSHTTFYLISRELDILLPSSSFQCITSLASTDEVDELFRNIQKESADGRYQLLVRRWYHKRGFGDCYLARTKDTNEICVVQWFVTSEHIKKLGWEDRFPIAEETFIYENLYTLERYRRQGAHTAVASQMREIALKRGFERVIAYNDEINVPQRKWYEKTKTKVSAKVLERHFLFHVTRKTLEEYNPPIPITALPDIYR